jgi:hypothetical protein
VSLTSGDGTLLSKETERITAIWGDAAELSQNKVKAAQVIC